MTENEVIKILDDIWTFGHEPTEHERLAANKAIDLIQELQQYRAIEAELKELYHANVDIKMLMKHFIEIIFKGERHDGFCVLTNEDVKMWEEYQAIGTVEECRKTRERQSGKKINNRILLRDLNGSPYSIRGDCPNCGSIGLLSTNTDYCNACGQKLDWSDTD